MLIQRCPLRILQLITNTDWLLLAFGKWESKTFFLQIADGVAFIAAAFILGSNSMEILWVK